jgi:hypothetical protein
MIFTTIDKVRTFEKDKSKRASKKSKMHVMHISSSYEEVDEFLKKKYGYGLWYFIYSLYDIAVLMKLRDLKKEINELLYRAKKLEIAKRKIIENVDQFLIDTNTWEGIKRNYPDLNIKWTTEKRERFIISDFNLNKFFRSINEQIEKINKRIKFLELYTTQAPDTRIKPRNFIILVWSKVMIEKENEENIDFINISALLNWFSVNKNWSSFFKSTELISFETPELTYSKYIKYAKNKKYEKLSTLEYILCFPDVAESATRMFPNPLDYLKIELEGRYRILKKELEGTFG